MVVAEFSCVAITNFKRLQGHHVTVVMQRICLVSMQTFMFHAVGVDVPLSPYEAAALDYSEWVLS